MCPAPPPGLQSPRSAPGTAGAVEGAEADAAEIYAAVKPSGREPQWRDPLPQLRPELRPYQRRAVHWMVQMEQQQVRQHLPMPYAITAQLFVLRS